MNTAGPEFLIGFICLSAIFFHLPTAWLRRAVFTLCNVAFLVTFVNDVQSLLLLALFLLSGYTAALMLARHPSSTLLGGYFALLVGAFVVLKKYAFLQFFAPGFALEHSVHIIGLSYMLFRQVHFVVDAKEGQIPSPSLLAYLNYQLNLFGLVAGPIQRFQQFESYWKDPRPALEDRHDLLGTYLRIGFGVLKVSVVAASCLWLYEHCANSLDPASSSAPLTARHAAMTFMGVFYLYPAYIYFNFSGYCDIVIGAARLIGLRMPENFVKPYLARNMIDYWTRWHRTLGLWVRDYLFTPMYRSTARRWPGRAASLAFLCYFAALLVAGVWHGTTINFVVFGLLNGLGVASAKAWENFLVKRGGRQGLREYLSSPRIRAAAVTANLHFVCLTIFFFPGDLARAMRIIQNSAGLIL